MDYAELLLILGYAKLYIGGMLIIMGTLLTIRQFITYVRILWSGMSVPIKNWKLQAWTAVFALITLVVGFHIASW